ncbi:hypothetical protein DL93DRAFT_2154637 [Clavulina sp. PMI_390]|nr:hypothetical protein DL93DRAFT_2154637 [Clavulina sp. PMI_390]
MSDKSFCRWVLSNSASVRDSVVADVTWWSAKRRPFYHQFVVLSVNYAPPNAAPSTYNIVLERIGKGPSIFQNAQHRVEIRSAKSLGDFRFQNRLLLGLFATSLEDRDNDQARWRWIEQMKRSSGKSFWDAPGFMNDLDEKWRGPPATLAHVARVIEQIVAAAPRYNLTSTNCYFFSRLLVHPNIAKKSLTPYHKHRGTTLPTTLAVFGYLKAQEDFNGVGAYSNVLLLLFGLVLIFIVIIAFDVMKVEHVTDYTLWTAIAVFSVGLGRFIYLMIKLDVFLALIVSTLISGAMVLVYAARGVGIYAAGIIAGIAFVGVGILGVVISVARDSLKAQTAALIKNLGQRGPYEPWREVKAQDRMCKEGLPPWPRNEQYYENLPKFYDGQPVHLPPPV